MITFKAETSLALRNVNRVNIMGWKYKKSEGEILVKQNKYDDQDF